MLCRATQNRRVIVKSSDKMWFTGGGNGKLPQYSSQKDTMNIMKRQKDMTPKEKVGRCPIHYRGRVAGNY